MRKNKGRPYFLISVALLIVLSLPPIFSEKLQNTTVEILSPFFEKLSYFKQSSQKEEEIARLELENKLLYANFIQLLELVENKENLMLLEEATPARVIFRSANSWFSSLWINVGSKSKSRVGKNSPVLAGNSVIGVIDYCGKKQSRVKLITDSGLSPSVRALREENGESHYLAKGELKGAALPLFRSGGNLLSGIGFNYDYADEKGPARDLRTGEPEDNPEQYKTLPLLKVNDLLVTTGMDGVFPQGLNVAKITKIHPLKEGDYYYELEAEPACGKLDDLSLVFVLPPVGFNFDEKPPLFGYTDDKTP